ncbi:A24 family peptidase [Erythrobacter fulvus]|nr:prepilin peptidase [Erythrobacter fulvus]
MEGFGATIPFALMACLAGVGAWTDITRRQLSNWLSLATLVAGLAVTAALGTPEVFLSHVGHFAVALGIGLALFAAGVWGGGDGKFYAAVASWFPIGAFFNLVVAISMVGLAMLIVMTVKSRGKLFRKDAVGVPYGVAIGLGALLVLGQGLW